MNRRPGEYIVPCMGTLYVVGTPIGNLEDITLRAARMLGEVSLVAAEDTRVTRRLLNHLGVRVPCVSCNEHNRRQRLPELLRVLQDGDVALVTDAGMPGVSDPGAAIVAAVADEGFGVRVIPGPSAVTTALAVSGMPSDSFTFLGFLPRRGKERRERLAGAAAIPDTLAIFESPHRIQTTLADLLKTLGDRRIAICRELTKLHEESGGAAYLTPLNTLRSPGVSLCWWLPGPMHRPSRKVWPHRSRRESNWLPCGNQAAGPGKRWRR